MSAAIQFIGWPNPENRPCTITTSCSATIMPGSYFSVGGRLLMSLNRPSRPESRVSNKDQPASIPPSTGMDAPVMYEARADATKAITCAISSGVARRLSGTVETSAVLFSSVRR